jgi:hypothetical protein
VVSRYFDHRKSINKIWAKALKSRLQAYRKSAKLMWGLRRGNRKPSAARSPRRPPKVLPIDAAHAEVFDFEEFLDAVFRAFAADAAFLHAAERRDLGRDDALVDADDAVFERLGDPPDAISRL